jgi:hypothetical protein
MNSDHSPIASFVHDDEIVRGHARVVYVGEGCAPKHGPWAGLLIHPGWVFPGGWRTSDRSIALLYAEKLNRMIAEHSPPRTVSGATFNRRFP